MTMLSFRLDDDEAARIQSWAEVLRIDRSQLLRDAVRAHLTRLSAEHDVDAWRDRPPTDDEIAIEAIADAGPAEDWSDWADAAR